MAVPVDVGVGGSQSPFFAHGRKKFADVRSDPPFGPTNAPSERKTQKHSVPFCRPDLEKKRVLTRTSHGKKGPTRKQKKKSPRGLCHCLFHGQPFSESVFSSRTPKLGFLLSLISSAKAGVCVYKFKRDRLGGREVCILGRTKAHDGGLDCPMDRDGGRGRDIVASRVQLEAIDDNDEIHVVGLVVGRIVVAP